MKKAALFTALLFCSITTIQGASYHQQQPLEHSSVAVGDRTHTSGGTGLQGGFMVVTAQTKAYNEKLDIRMKDKLGIQHAPRNYNSSPVEVIHSSSSSPHTFNQDNTNLNVSTHTRPTFSDIATSL